jgi:hypothetical protein
VVVRFVCADGNESCFGGCPKSPDTSSIVCQLVARAGRFFARPARVLFLVAAQPAPAGKIRASLEHNFNRDSEINTDNTFEIRDEELQWRASA